MNGPVWTVCLYMAPAGQCVYEWPCVDSVSMNGPVWTVCL